MRFGGRPPTISIQNQASHLVHLLNFPPDGGDAVMQLAVPIVAETRVAAAASINERAILLQDAQAQETTLVDQMSQMGYALQRLSTDATLSEAQRKEQERTIANLHACAGNLRSAGAELERQHQ